MSDIKFQQAHSLGLDKARELAQEWMNDAARQLGLDCKLQQGAEQDTITFDRMGVNGTMRVSGDSFDLHIKLGMMMAAFKPMIEAEVSKNLAKIVARASGQA